MFAVRLRVFRTICALAGVAAMAGLVTGCQPAVQPSATGSSSASGSSSTGGVPSAAATTMPAGDGPANRTQVCKQAIEVVQDGYLKMSGDAIDRLDRPVSQAEKERQIDQRYITMAKGLREQAQQAADPEVRTAVENIAVAIERRLGETEPMRVKEPQVQQLAPALHRACGT